MGASTEPPPLIWIDMEMSGLDPGSCRILELASIVTDAELSIVAEGPDLVVHQPDAVLDAMDEWNTRHHGQSGLTEAVRRSTISEAQAESLTLEFLRAHCLPGASPLCGNSVGQDRRFAEAYMPSLAGFLHYRTIDVTTVKELARRWYPDVPMFTKKESHRALDDIKESIEELRWLRARVFR